MAIPTPSEAVAALDEIDAEREAVVAARPDVPALALTASAVLTVIDYGAKDVWLDWRPRAAVTVLTQATSIAVMVGEARSRQVQNHPVEPGSAAAWWWLAGAGVWLVTERTAVDRLRRSRLQRPNLVAGVLLAATRSAAFIAFDRTTRARRG